MTDPLGPPPRILLVRLSSFGDILLTTPVLTALQQRYPNAQIDFVTYERFCGALQHHPDIDRLLTLPKKAISRSARMWRPVSMATSLWRFIRELRAERYDLVVDLHNVFDSAAITLLARGRHKVGNARQALSRLYQTRCRFDDQNETAQEHATLTNLRYLVEAGWLAEYDVPAAPQPSFHTPDTAKHSVDRFLVDNQLVGRELIGLNPGGSYVYKRWPAARFAEVGRALHGRHGAPILLFGGPAEREVVSEVARGVGAPIVDTSQLPMFEAFELISRLRLFVTNDSAPLHIAAAAGTPTVGLYGPANFDKFRPLTDAVAPVVVEVACRPCTPSVGRACGHRSCFEKIDVARVLAACGRRWDAAADAAADAA